MAARMSSPEATPGATAAYDLHVRADTQVLVDICQERGFREAVAWQNPPLVGQLLDKFVQEYSESSSSRARYRTATICNLVQRYSTKNDSIGFFGPVGWGWLRGDGPGLQLGTSLDALSRSTFFEAWAIEELARSFEEDPEMVPWLRPALAGCHVLDGELVHRPVGPPVRVSPHEARVLSRLDGETPVRDLGEDAEELLRRWIRADLVEPGLVGRIEARPELSLRAELTKIGDDDLRTRALAKVDQLVHGLDDVRESAGDPERVVAAMDALGTVFARTTQKSATRRAGEMYAGRTLVYHDSVRTGSFTVGGPVLDALSAPLELVLTSVRWLVGALTEAYEDLLSGIFDRCCAAEGGPSVPLGHLVARATPLFLADAGEPPAPVAALISEFQARWRTVAPMQEGARRYDLSTQVLQPLVRATFPPVGRPWAGAMHHSPDVMIVADDVAGVNSGHFSLMLGELHVAMNTLEARPFVGQHPDPRRLRALNDADFGHRRVYAVPTRRSPHVSPRTYPSALLPSDCTYWAMHPENTGADGQILPAAALRVVREDPGLFVTSYDDGRRIRLVEALGEQLSSVAVGAFRPFAPAPHVARVAIDRLVISRETWRYNLGSLDWASGTDRARRHAEIRRWHEEAGMPVRCFYRVSGERKPLYVDFSSVLLVDLFARMVRRALRSGPGFLEVSEMLPDLDRSWLPDSSGNTYTSELRMVAVDGGLRDRRNE
jgi:hypothetical protein